MNKWKEKPLSRILAGLLALLLAIGTLPASPFRANAVDTGTDSSTTTSAKFKLVFEDPRSPGTEQDASFIGIIVFTKDEETISAEISNGFFTVRGFTSGETYNYSVTLLENLFFFNGTEFLTFTAPVDGSVKLEDGITDGKMVCGTADPVPAVERFGYVTTQVGDTSEYLKGVAITINESSLVSPIIKDTDDNGKYSFSIPEPLIGEEVTITAQKNYFVTETVTRTIPETASGEDPQQEIEAIAINPITATFNVDEKGYICIGEDTTQQTGEITIHPTGPVSFTVAPNDADYYQIDSVSATLDILSEAGGTYNFSITDTDIVISVGFIKKDTTKPVIEIVEVDDEYYYGTPDEYNQCWGSEDTDKTKLRITDPAASGEVEYISRPTKLYICLGTVTSVENVIDKCNTPGEGYVISLNASANSIEYLFENVEPREYTFMAVDAADGSSGPNYSDLLSVTFKKDTENPFASGVSLSPLDAIVTTDNAYTSTAEMNLSVFPQDNGGSGLKKAVLYYKNGQMTDYSSIPMGKENGQFVATVGFNVLTELAVDIWDNAGNHMGRTLIADLNPNDEITKNYVLVKANAATTVVAKVGETAYSTTDKPNFNAIPEYIFTVSDDDDGIKVTVFINGTIVSERTNTFGKNDTIELTDYEKQAFLEGENTITVSCTNFKGITVSPEYSFVLDKTEPKVTFFTLTPVPGGETILNSTADATFANGTIAVTVTAEDPLPTGVTTNSGLKSITLFINDTTSLGPIDVDENGKAVFTLDPSTMSELIGTPISLSATANDNAGNTIVTAAVLGTGNSSISTDTFTFDIKAPEITISNPLKLTSEETATAHYTGEGENQKAWYSEFVRWNVSLSDDVSGIESIEVKLNGTKLDTALDGTTITASLSSFSVSSEAVATDCSSVLTVSVTDKAGNTDEVTKTVYIDMFAPEIKGFLVKGKDGSMHSDAEGNYTNGPVIISVTAEDPGLSSQNAGAAAMPVSGVESISLYIDGSEKPLASSAPDANGKCEFSIFSDIPEDFFETHTVTVEATDCSGLKSARVPLASGSNQGFSSGKIVIENRKPSVSITLSDTGKKTIDGKTWYGADTEVKIQATDAESGLATIAVTVNGTAITVDDSATPQAIGTFASKEKSSPVYVIKTANHIASDDKYTIRVTVKDVSGNVYETEETFFIDRTAPVISGFTVTTEKAGDTISNLAFGTFANGRVRVTITVKDDGSSAGLDAVALTINDGTPVVSKLSNGVAEFILPEEVVEGFYGAYSLKATAVDVYGHTSEVKTYERQIQIDTVKPTVSVSAAGPNPMAKDGKTWYSSDVTWTIRLRDANAGIASATVKVNGTVIANEVNGKSISEILAPTDAGSVKDVTFAVITSQAAASADGSYTITVETTDYIGNKSEVYSGTVYVDKTAPAITSFAFLRDGEAVSPLTASDFGYVYFFEKDATVVISANDAANGYGLKSITYYMEDFNGVKTVEQTATPDASGNVTITVKAPFRGKIYAKATDGVNNESGYAASKGFAAETKANHDGTASVSIERNETELRQPNGVDLYSGNVEIKINIADEIAGIKTVEWSVSAPYDQAKNQTGSASVGIDGTITGDGWTATAKDGNLVTGLSRTLTVTHDSNDITVRVRMTDWAGNTTERQTVFGIDKVAPIVEYSFDNNTADPANPTIFDDERTLTITVTERNFVPGEFGLTIHNAYGSVPTISQWTEERDTQDPNKSTYTATVTFVYDGSYTLTLGYADRAGNRAAIEQVPAFVIDRSKPLVLVTYDNKKPVQDIYFDNFRTATVTVTERNFDVSRVTFTGNAPRTGTWTANGEEHTLTIYYDEDGDYSFGISVVDKAGNVSVPYDEERFIIDTTVPELELTGLLAANRGEVAPVITYTDANYMEDGVSFLLQRQNGDIINKPYTIEEIVEDGEAKGYRIVFKNFDPMKENDDIYTIQISAVDQAGNRTQQIMRRFSVNRFGSTYIMDGVEKMNGSNTNNPTDLVVLEVNVDEINADDVEIFVIRNSSPTKLVFGRDYDWEKVKMTEDGWEEYRYVIKSSSFAEDGEYTIRIISVDKAGNVNENDENGKNATISFCVDRVAPNIVVVSPVDETSYKEDTHRAVIEVRDNYLLGDVKIYLNDAEVSYSKSNYQYSFEIPQSDTKQTIRIVATDAAGNVSEVIVKDFLVSTNVFVRFLNTTWAIVAFIAILLCIGGAAVFILARRRRR